MIPHSGHTVTAAACTREVTAHVAAVKRIEPVKRELLTRQLHDTLHNQLPAPRREVRHIVVHARIILRAIYSAPMEIATFVNIHNISV